jgi:FkbM family methyltransferase
MFGAWLLGRHPDCELLSIEPDRRNARMLRQTIEANEAQRCWRMLEAAVATAPGRLGFAGSDFATSHVVPDPTAPTVPAVDFFEQAVAADLIKVDIEGSEWEILADARMRDLAARALVLEYHPENCPHEDSHGLASSLLEAAGFTTRTIFKATSGVGMLWACRARTVGRVDARA